MDIKTLTIGDKSFKIMQVSAVQQRKLLCFVGAITAFNTAKSGANEISIDLLKGMLLSLNPETLDQITDIIFSKCFIDGTEEKVELGHFQGAMNTYLELIAEGIKLNLGDFFTWLESENASPQQAENQTKAE